MPRSYYDDNFGHYDIRDEEDMEFYHNVQAQSKTVTCSGCGRKKKLRPGTICNSCADTLERGGDLNY